MTGYSRDEVIGLNIADIVAPDHVELARSMIQRKLDEQVPTTYELDIVSKFGRRSTIEVNSQLIYQNGKAIGVQGIARDVTERRRAESELRARERKQAAVAQLGQHALVSTDLSLLFKDTVSWVVHTLDVAYCTILERSDDGSELVGRAGSGWNTDLVGSGRVGAGPQSFAGFTLLSSEPVIVEDFSRETRFSIPRILTAHDVQSGMSVIVAGSQTPFGVLTVFTDAPRDFSRDDVHFLSVRGQRAGGGYRKEAARRRAGAPHSRTGDPRPAGSGRGEEAHRQGAAR